MPRIGQMNLLFYPIMKCLRSAISVWFGLFCSLSAVNAAVTLAPVTRAWSNGPAVGSSPLSSLYDGDTLVKTNPDDVSTWVHGGLPGSSNAAWQETWQAGSAAENYASWGNVGWVILDLGSVLTTLDTMYLWNLSENNSTSQSARGVQQFNIWYSTSPTLPGSTTTSADYNFGTGWTQLGSTETLARAAATGINGYDGAFDLSDISSARYIGLELLTNYGSGFGADGVNRVGLSEVVFTVPEPSSALLALTGLTACVIRRRRF